MSTAPTVIPAVPECDFEMGARKPKHRAARRQVSERTFLGRNLTTWQPSSALLRKEFLNIMFITAAVFTITGAVVAVRSAFGSESEEAWAVPMEDDLQAGRKRIYCFFNHSAYRRPEPMTFTVDNVQVEHCDDIVYTFLGIDPAAANIISKDPKYDVHLEGIRRFAKLRERDVSLVIWAALGGSRTDNDAFNKIASVRRSRVEFAENSARWLQQYGYDGIILYWIYPLGDTERSNFGSLIKSVKKRLSAEGLRLAVVVPGDKTLRKAGFDVRELAQTVDVIFVDTHRTVDPSTFPVTTFFSPLRVKTQAKRLGQTGLSYVLGDLSVEVNQMEKVVFGLTLAGVTFTLKDPSKNKAGDPVKGPGNPGVFTKEPGLLGHFEIDQLLAHDLSWSRQFDRVSQCPYLVSGDQWVGFEDDVSLQSKSHLVLFTGGIAVWDISMDDFRGSLGKPLLARARDIFLRNHTLGRTYPSRKKG
ncbi:chitinase-3-like protein 1 [Ornithodoros turicata]|uniref:chitinase-3-like protein 1 n=1 Tax=Ornithodoros turicata TaxID=34597 RepID=UPI003138D037